MNFDLPTWKTRIAGLMPNWKSRLDRAALDSAYYFVAATAFLPLAQAAAGGDWSALVTLGTTLGGSVGANLLANLVQQAKDRPESELARLLQQQAAAQPEIKAALDTLLEKLDALNLARQELAPADRAWFETAIQRELGSQRGGTSYNASLHGDGAIAQGNGSIAVGKGGVIAGRDMHNNLINTGNINVFLPSSPAAGGRPDSSPLVIAVVTKVEAQAVFKAFGVEPAQAQRLVNQKIYYDLGTHGGAPVLMVQSETGTATVNGALVTIHQAVQDLNARGVVLCGVAYGLRPDEQKLGDILVSKQLEYYEPQKVDLEHRAIPRGDRATASGRLLSLFRAADLAWYGAPVHFGLVLSGEKLVNDPNFRAELLRLEPEAIGGEMEGAGLYTAARGTDADWILVKGICDWADGNKDDQAQPLAAENAARFVKAALG